VCNKIICIFLFIRVMIVYMRRVKVPTVTKNLKFWLAIEDMENYF